VSISFLRATSRTVTKAEAGSRTSSDTAGACHEFFKHEEISTTINLLCIMTYW